MCLSFQQNKTTGTRTVVEKPKIKQILYPKNIAKILMDLKSGSQRNNRKTFMIKKNQFFDFGVKVFLKNRLIRKIKVPSKLLNILTVSRVLSQSTWSFAK